MIGVNICLSLVLVMGVCQQNVLDKIYTSSVQLLVNSSNAQNYPVGYPQGFDTSYFAMCGINAFALCPTAIRLWVYVHISIAPQLSFGLLYQQYSYYPRITIAYIVIKQQIFINIFQATLIDIHNSSTCLSVQYTKNFSDKIKVVLFIRQIDISNSIDWIGYNQSVTIDTVNKNITISVSRQVANCSIRVFYQVLIVDAAQLLANNVFISMSPIDGNQLITSPPSPNFPSNTRYLYLIASFACKNITGSNLTLFHNGSISKLVGNYKYLNVELLFLIQCNDNNWFVYKDECFMCGDIIPKCIICQNNNTCTTCSTNYTTIIIDNRQICQCDSSLQLFAWSNYCAYCSYIFPHCLVCGSNITCNTCADGYFWNGTGCKQCDSNCVTCTNSSTFCLSCNSQHQRVLMDNSCKCVEQLSDCRYSAISCDPLTCSYLNTIGVNVKQIYKSYDSNKMKLLISFGEYVKEAEEYFKDIFQFEFDGEKVSCQIQKYQISCEFQYQFDLHGSNVTGSVDLTKTGLWYFALAPVVNFSTQIQTTNNLNPGYYSAEIYQQRSQLEAMVIATVVLTFVAFGVGLAFAKIVVLEMMGTAQVAFLGSLTLDQIEPLAQPLYLFKHANGYNYFIQYFQQGQPDQVYYNQHAASTISNLNISLLFLIIPPIIALILNKILNKTPKYKIRFQYAWKLILGEWYLTCFIFLLYNYSTSLVSIMYSTNFSSFMFYLSVLEIVIITGIFGFLLWMFFTKDRIWLGEYREKFNWNKFSSRYYIFPIAQRVIVGVLMVSLNKIIASSIVSTFVFVGVIIVVGYRRPFITLLQNIRSILFNAYNIVILILYAILGSQPQPQAVSVYTYIPYAIVGVVFMNTITGLGFVIYSFVETARKKKDEKSCEEYLKQEQQLCFQLSLKANRKMQDVRDGLYFSRK